MFGITILYMAGPRSAKLVAPALACQRPAHDAGGASVCTAGGAVRPGGVAIPGRPPSAKKHVIVKCVIFNKGPVSYEGTLSVLREHFLY